MIPSRRLVLLSIIPVGLALAALLVPSLLWTMLALDGALAVIAALDLVLALPRLVTVERDAPAVLSVGRPNVVALELRSRARRTLDVKVTDALFEHAEGLDLPAAATLPPRGSATVRYRVRPTRRGAFALGDHVARYGSPLGLWIRQLRLAARSPVKVYPDVQAVRTFELLARQDREYALVRASRMKGGESEFARLRDHLPDDEFRAIDWKATARRGKLIAREYQLERNQNIVFLLDCGRLMTAESGGLSLLDHALNAVLMMSHVAARSGDHVGLLAFDAALRAWLPPAGGAGATRRVVQASYDLHPALVETDYRRAFDTLALRMRKRALVVLFTQVIDDVSAEGAARLMKSLLPRHLPLIVMLRDVEVDALAEPIVREQATPSPTGEPTDFDLYQRGAAAEMIVWRDKLLRDMKQAGTLVLDVAPDRLTPALINRYLKIKARQLL